MRKIIESLMLVMIFCVSASADIVYTTDAGDMGLIKINSSTSADFRGTQYSGSASDDLLLGAYWNGSSTRIILVNRAADAGTSGDTALIFDPADLTKPIDDDGSTLYGVYGARAMTYSNNGRGLFISSGASIHEFNTSNLSPARSYTRRLKTSTDILPEITSLLVGTYTVYALADREESEDLLLMFDGQLKDDIKDYAERNLRYGASEIAWLSNSRLVAADELGVSVYSGGEFVSFVDTYYPVKSVCSDAGDGCYFIEQAQSGDAYVTILRHYHSDGSETTLYTDTEGSVCRLVRDGNNGVLAAIVGSKLLVYKTDDDELVMECANSMLGGLPTGIAMGYASGDKSSSSGCDASSLGMIMLLAGTMMILKRRR